MNPKKHLLIIVLIVLPFLACPEPEPEVVDSLDRDKQRINDLREHTKETSEQDEKRDDYWDYEEPMTPINGGGPK